MKTMFRAKKHFPYIEKILVVRETDKFFTVAVRCGDEDDVLKWTEENVVTRREAKVTCDSGIFETWEEAKGFLVSYTEGKKRLAAKELDRAVLKCLTIDDLTQEEVAYASV